MAYSLFLDDERYPPDGPAPRGMWIIVRTFSGMMEVVNAAGMPAFVSFDHDLGEEKTGMDVAKWLIERDLSGTRFPKSFSYRVHSMNPVGAANIDGLMKSYLAQR